MLRPIIGEMIEVRLKLAPGLGGTLGDPVEMDQVVMNLLLNARDAMPTGGAITIETENDELDPAAAAKLEMQPGPCVTLRISDTGRGIAPDAMARIFDPFFTTKALGKGAGIGLSTVRNIVRECHGAVWATSELGSGATFHVCLPRMPDHDEVADPQTERLTPQRGNETVLLVEDEESVRRLLSQVLNMRGYRVIEAPDGERALELIAQRGSEIDLVLTDVIMPKLTGVELAEKLLEIRPEMPLIFMSGYPDDQLSTGSAIRAGRRFLRKPLLPDALSTAVREVLDSPSRPFDRY
jgi:CheY-like chemotaxis protein